MTQQHQVATWMVLLAQARAGTLLALWLGLP